MPRDARDETPDVSMTGALLALAYPDRIGRRRAGHGKALSAVGRPRRGAARRRSDGQRGVPGRGRSRRLGAGRAHLPRRADRRSAEIEELYAERIVDEETLQWSEREGAVLARRRRRLGALVLEDKPLGKPDPEKLKAAMLDGMRQLGLAALPWSDDLAKWRERIAFLRRLDESWPDLSDEALLASLEDWLAPFLDGISRRDHLARLDLAAALKALVPWDKQRAARPAGADPYRRAERLARADRLYEPAEPTLSVRLQEMFGLADTPRVGGGKVPLTIHLLSPARRPVQVTRDLASFWANGYKAVKAELKGRYPRHYWPDDPLVAEPTARVRPRPR